MRLFYQLAIFLIALGYFPKALFQSKRTLKSRFTVPALKPANKPRIWIHACSVGETKAASTLSRHLQDYDLVISSTTDTGHATAKQLFPNAQHIFMPYDMRPAMKLAFSQIKPDLLIIVESDFWFNLIHEATCPIAVVSGVLSKRSYKRHKRFPAFAKKLFEPVSLILVQNQIYQDRFADLGIQTQIGGNLKFDVQPTVKPAPEDFIVTIGSTHDGEEELILNALEPLTKRYPNLKLLVVPRHPERFDLVKQILQSKSATPICEMGVLPSCYAKSKLAIVAGSFNPTVGGHNILEPIQLGVPVLFGPHMHAQEELKNLVLNSRAGKQLQAGQLAHEVEAHLTDPDYHNTACQNASKLHQSLRGVSQNTYDMLNKLLKAPNKTTMQDAAKSKKLFEKIETE